MESKYDRNSVGGLIEALLTRNNLASALTAAENILARHMYDRLTDQQIHMYLLSFQLLFACNFPAHASEVGKATAIASSLLSSLKNRERFTDTHRSRRKND